MIGQQQAILDHSPLLLFLSCQSSMSEAGPSSVDRTASRAFILLFDISSIATSADPQFFSLLFALEGLTADIKKAPMNYFKKRTVVTLSDLLKLIKSR